MGFDFVLLLKAHDLFIKPFTRIAQLRSSQRRKVSFIWETVFQSENIQEGRGSGRCHTELLPRFCLGPAYVLSHYLVQAFVGVFDTRSPLKLEDVYMGLLAKRFRVTLRRHRGFMADSLNGRFFFSVQA